MAAFEEKESDEPKGQVVETHPAAGEQVPEGTKITVYFSDGPEKVPDVVGMTEDAADAGAQAGRLQGVRDHVERHRGAQGHGDQAEPRAAAAEQPEGTSVTIVVSTFEEPTETPTPTPSDTPTVLPTDTPAEPQVPPTP